MFHKNPRLEFFDKSKSIKTIYLFAFLLLPVKVLALLDIGG